MTQEDRICANVLRGALAANNVSEITWPDGTRDNFTERWDDLHAVTQEHWASLGRVVFAGVNAFPPTKDSP